ncbi:hypothetical protein FWG86_01410 [Candidatus Saccharibacteria bacterium]|nr:hypothetical protein [Candidatus Saccharibacteria bacterium]
MKKRFQTFSIFIASILAGAFLVSANVYADPTLPTIPETPATPVVPAPAPTPTPEEPEEEEEEEEEESAPVNNCTDQMGKMAWAICPITGIIAAGTDAAMSALEALLVVNMQADVFDSPLFYIWQYIRNMANIVFVIMFLIMIFSHFTQWNITNYALRRAAPKLLVVAILINLSFYVSVAAVNISDILGVSLVGLFDSVAEGAASSGAISLADIPTWEAVFAVATGAVVVGGGLALGLVISGGLSGLFFVLAPVLLGALVAVLAALFTMAARQALIFLLVMLSPLAFAALLLTSTEKFFDLWRKFFLQMLVIFPMFAVLFGAARLAGWAIIATADGMLQVVLGMAVQVVPLVMTPALLRMSGTMLGKVNDLVRKPFAPAQTALGGWSKEQQAIARARNVNAGMRGQMGLMGSSKLAAFLEKQKALRGESLALENKSATHLVGSYVDKYVSAHSLKKGNFELDHKLGYTAKQAGVDELHAGIASLDRASTLNESSAWTDAAHPARTPGQKKLAKIAGQGSQAWLQTYTALERKARNDDGDLRFQTKTIQAAYRAKETYDATKNNPNFNAADVMSAEELQEYNKGLSDYEKYIAPIGGTLFNEYNKNNRITARITDVEAKKMLDYSASRAVQTYNMMDKKEREAYAILFNDTKKTYDIQRSLRNAFKESDLNKMTAAIDVMALRGDYNLITDEIAEATKNWSEAGKAVDSDEYKYLMDCLLKYKPDAAHLASYAKSMNIRRGKFGNFEGKIQVRMQNHPDETRDQAVQAVWEQIALEKGKAVNDLIREHENATRPLALIDWAKDDSGLGMLKLLADITQPGIAKSQDRTTFEAIGDLMREAGIKPDALQAGFLVKQLRSAATSGEIDGETLTNLTDLLLWRTERREDGGLQKILNRDTVASYLKDMSAAQLKGMKAGQIAMINDALLGLNEMADDEKKGRGWAVGEVADEIGLWMARAKWQIANGNGMLMSEMNTDILTKLKIAEMTERGGKFETSDIYNNLWGDPGKDNSWAPMLSSQTPEYIDAIMRIADSAHITQLGMDKSLVEKLVDYRLGMHGSTRNQSFALGNIDEETQAMFNRLGAAERNLIDVEVRDRLGWTTKKPSL